MEAQFEEPELFQQRYQRNNKRGGLKNLRCFPTCAAMHRERGFCGRMVVLMVRHAPGVKLTVFGEFVPVLDKAVGLKIEDTVTREKAMEICRDKSNPTKPWMEGEIIEEAETYTRFAFNRDKKGWHYGWASNKHTCNASHALQAYVMETAEIDTLVVKGVYQSPQFTLFCRRRRRFAMVPSAPIAPPASRKRSSKSLVNDENAKQAKMDDEDDEDDESEEEEGENDAPSPSVPAEKPKKEPKQKKPKEPKERKRKASETAEPKPPKEKKARKAKEPKEKKVTLKDASTKKRKSPAAGKKSKNLVVVETNLQDGDSRRAQEVTRIEKMLREISKRITRAKPVLPQSSAISRSGSPTEMFSGTDSASTTTSEEPSMFANEQFSANLFECIDFFAGDSLLDDHVFEGDFLRQVEESSNQSNRLIDELANYFLEEKGFADAISGLARATKGSDNREAFDSFVQVLTSYLSGFLRRKGLTLKDFDDMFPEEETEVPFMSGGEMIARSAFQHVIDDDEESFIDASLLLPQFPMDADEEIDIMPHRINGSWVLAADSERLEDDGIESMRESLGYPWLLRKMLNFMEEKFHVSLENGVLSVRLQRKLFASGAMKIVLDGEEHDWGMKLPMFEGIAGNWKYRAWINDGVIHHLHDTGGGVNSRMRRQMFVDDQDRLQIEISLEEFNNETGQWDAIAQAVQRAVRCT